MRYYEVTIEPKYNNLFPIENMVLYTNSKKQALELARDILGDYSYSYKYHIERI